MSYQTNSHIDSVSDNNTKEKKELEIPLIGYLSVFSDLIPVLAGFARFNRLEKDFRLFLILLTYNVLGAGLQYYLSRRSINNLWVGHLSNLIEYVIIMLVFSNWQREKVIKTQIRTSIVIFALFWIISKLYFERLNQPTIYTSSVSRVLFCGISVYVLYSIAEQIRTSVFRDPRFWIVAAVLFSSAGDLMFYAFRGVIARLPKEELLLAFSVHWVLLIVVNLVYTGAFLLRYPAGDSAQNSMVTLTS